MLRTSKHHFFSYQTLFNQVTKKSCIHKECNSFFYKLIFSLYKKYTVRLVRRATGYFSLPCRQIRRTVFIRNRTSHRYYLKYIFFTHLFRIKTKLMNFYLFQHLPGQLHFPLWNGIKAHSLIFAFLFQGIRFRLHDHFHYYFLLSSPTLQVYFLHSSWIRPEEFPFQKALTR